MTQHIQSRHLTHENLCDLLFAEDDTSQGIRRDHLRECLVCAAELDVLRTSVGSFRTASITIANRIQTRRPQQTRSALLIARPRQGFVWATAALVLAAALPVGIYKQNIRTHFQSHAVAGNQPSTTTPRVRTLESDEALLESINRDLSASIPSSMESLTGPSASTSASISSSDASPQTNSKQRKN